MTFVAIVTDGNGLDDIAGGELVDDTGATYAAFGAGATKGTFTATVTFAQINQVRSIEFPLGGGQRQLSAKFFDNDGNTAVSSITLSLQCRDKVDGSLSGACGGVCADISADGVNCGACGKTCATGLVCQQGQCAPVTATTTCLDARWLTPQSSCDDVCKAAGDRLCGDTLSHNTPACTDAGGVASRCADPIGAWAPWEDCSCL